MKRLIKFVVYILCIVFVGLVGYAYLGPIFGVDFSATQDEIREPVILNVD